METEIPANDHTAPATNAAPQRDRREERRCDSEPAIVPSVLFDQETANSIDWKAYYPF